MPDVYNWLLEPRFIRFMRLMGRTLQVDQLNLYRYIIRRLFISNN